MEVCMSKAWWAAAGIRALKTLCQTAVATIGVSAAVTDVDWVAVGGAAVLAAVLSLLTSLGGLPEVKQQQ
jgi:O-antigen/teichoic acid export membrane protein